MKNFFQYIFSKSSVFLFYIGLSLAIILTGSFFYLATNYPTLLINAEPSEFDFFKSTTLLGKFYIISGIFPNFLFLILIFRLIKFIISAFLELLIRFFEILGSILGLIFSNENFNKLEKTFASNKPKINKKVKKTVKTLNLNKSEKNVFWMAPIAALGVGILPLPIGYYMLSRLIVSGCALYFAHKFYKKKTTTKLWIFGFFVVLYNPIAPIYLYEKAIWILINIPTIYYFYINRRFA